MSLSKSAGVGRVATHARRARHDEPAQSDKPELGPTRSGCSHGRIEGHARASGPRCAHALERDDVGDDRVRMARSSAALEARAPAQSPRKLPAAGAARPDPVRRGGRPAKSGEQNSASRTAAGDGSARTVAPPCGSASLIDAGSKAALDIHAAEGRAAAMARRMAGAAQNGDAVQRAALAGADAHAAFAIAAVAAMTAATAATATVAAAATAEPKAAAGALAAAAPAEPSAPAASLSGLAAEARLSAVNVAAPEAASVARARRIRATRMHRRRGCRRTLRA